jgi:hypothetical protein
VINLINMKLSLISLKLNAELELGWVLDATIQIAAKVKDGDSSVLYPNYVNQYCEMVVGELEKLQKVKGSDTSVDLQASINLLNEFFVVFRSRSTVGKGTRIRIEIPIPADVLHHIKSHI